MKKHILMSDKIYFRIWLSFHLLIFTAFTAALFLGKNIQIDADLFNMLPKPDLGKALNASDAKLTEITGQTVFILVSNEDFAEAKKTAEKAYSELKDISGFKSVSFYQDNFNFSSVINFIHKYRWNLLDGETASSLGTSGGAEMFCQNALAKAYGAFTITPLEMLEEDPFMLGEYNLQNYLKSLQASGTKMSLKDGVLASFYNGKWYVMIRGILNKKGAALASKTNAVSQIYKICSALEENGSRFIYSGTPFHSHKSSSNASKEIAVISVISMTAVLLILFMIFKRSLPILFSIVSIFISTSAAVCSVLAVFGKMHILTLVFGTSLIGSCIDYSLHYFINWKANKKFSLGKDVRNHLLTGISLSLISTELCYFILIFAPFNLLKQMAVFSMSGIFSSFLTVICIYPYIPVPAENRDIFLIKQMKTPSWYNKKTVGRIVVTFMFVCSLLALLIFRNNLKIENNVNKLYTIEGKEAENEKEAAAVLQYMPTGWFIVSGDTVDETLQNEEMLTKELKALTADRNDVNFVCISKFIPSIKMQNLSKKAVSKLIPYAENQYEALGYNPVLSEKLQKDFEQSNSDYVILGENVPAFLEQAVSSAWIGEIEGKYYSVVLPSVITDENAYRKIAESYSGVYFINKLKDMNTGLDKLSRMILTLFAVAYFVIFIVLRFFYTWKQTFKITSVPLLIVLITSAIFAAAKINLEFFSITGMILVFGLGLDYVIYMIENEKRKDESESSKIEPFAIALSFVTTAVSFGALALSSFVPVRMISLSIFIGLVTAFVSTFFYTRADFY